MFEKALTMYIYAETPIHAGSGAYVGGAVDLPIQRERHTELPIIQGSSLKGVLRNYAETYAETIGINKNKIEKIFGKPDLAGGISVTDARMLVFPVRTLKGVFGWTTCRLVLDRFKRDLKLAGKSVDWEPISPSDKDKAVVINSSGIVLEDGNVYAEELKLAAEENSENLPKIVESICEALPSSNEYKTIRNKLSKDVFVVADEVFRELTKMTVEVVTRIRIGEKGTVEEGGLWSEEELPVDSLMYSLILIPKRLQDLNVGEVALELKKYDSKILQIGGDESIGRGFVRVKVI